MVFGHEKILYIDRDLPFFFNFMQGKTTTAYK